MDSFAGWRWKLKDTVQKCLAELGKVEESMLNPESGYLVRTRLKRAVLSCAQAVAKETAEIAPLFPSRLQIKTGAEPRICAIAECCNRIIESAEIVCQPSEPLDERWRSGWSGILEDVRRLETLLASN